MKKVYIFFKAMKLNDILYWRYWLADHFWYWGRTVKMRFFEI